MKIEIEGAIYYDTPEIGKMLGVHKRTIYSWVKTGKLKAHKVGRKYLIKSEALKQFIEAQEIKS